MISRRTFTASLGLGALLAMSPATTSRVFAADMAKVRFGVDPYTTGTQVWVAKEKGYFAAHGVDATVNIFATGIESLDAALTGQLDIGVGLDFPTALRMQSGQLKILAAIFASTPGFHKLVVSDAIKSTDDLKGKKFGVATGTAQELVTVQYLANKGVSPTDVSLVPFSSLVEIVGSLRAHRIDGAFVWSDGIKQATSAPGFKIMASDAEAALHQSGFICANKQFATNNHDAVVNVLRAINDATAFIDANPEEAAKIVSTQTKGPYDSTLDLIKTSHFELQLTETEKQSFATIAAFASKVIKTPISFETAVDPSFLKEAVPQNVSLSQ